MVGVASVVYAHHTENETLVKMGEAFATAAPLAFQAKRATDSGSDGPPNAAQRMVSKVLRMLGAGFGAGLHRDLVRFDATQCNR